MKKQGVQALLVEKCFTKEEASGTIHVEVPYQNKDAVMCVDFWPLGVKIGGWRFLRTKQKKSIILYRLLGGQQLVQRQLQCLILSFIYILYKLWVK